MIQELTNQTYLSFYRMLTSISEEEMDNWYKLFFSEDVECQILAVEIFNSFGDTNFCYYTLMNILSPNRKYKNG